MAKKPVAKPASANPSNKATEPVKTDTTTTAPATTPAVATPPAAETPATTPPASAPAGEATKPATKKRNPATPKPKPAFVPSAIQAAIVHAGNTRLADLKHYYGIDADGITVTPCVGTVALLQTILTGNVNNRPLNKANMNKLKTRMCNGQWDWNVPVIVIIDTLGRVHNAQHCATACIEAEGVRTSSTEWMQHFADLGMDQPLSFRNLIVISGLPPEVANHWDTGRMRSHADIVFRTELLQNDKRTQAQVVRLSTIAATASKFAYLRFALGRKQRTSYPFGHEDMISFLEQYPDLLRSVEFVYDEEAASGKDGKVALSKRMTLPQAALLHFLMSNSATTGDDDADDQDAIAEAGVKADQFIKQIAMGGVPGGDDVVSKLCAYLSKHFSQSGQGNVIIEKKFDAILMAAYAFLNEQPITDQEMDVAPEVHATDADGNKLWLTSTGIRGYTDEAGTFHYWEGEDETTWTKAFMKSNKQTLTPITVPSYPHLGGLDVPPSDEDDEEIEDDTEAEATADDASEDPSTDAEAAE